MAEIINPGYQAQRALPKYKCHKRVWALQIESVEPDAVRAEAEGGRETDGSTWLHPVNKDYAPFKVSKEYAEKHSPEIGGYWVQYEDGYQSYSPAAPFESGYTLIQ